MNTLAIMRGLPGSGKSTLAKALAAKYKVTHDKVLVFSTDDFFMKGSIYAFNPAQIATAHLWNQKRAMMAMIESVPQDNDDCCIIIDNTCTQAWEARDYVKPAHLLGFRIEIHQPDTEWAFNAEECAKKTVHGVPLESIQTMLARWEKDITVESILASKAPWEQAMAG